MDLFIKSGQSGNKPSKGHIFQGKKQLKNDGNLTDFTFDRLRNTNQELIVFRIRNRLDPH